MTFLFDKYDHLPPPSQPTQDAQQDAELARVGGRIAASIREFAAIVGGRDWHAQELHEFVAAAKPVAPASCDRVLRSMRHELPYQVINRRQSLYRFDTKAHR